MVTQNNILEVICLSKDKQDQKNIKEKNQGNNKEQKTKKAGNSMSKIQCSKCKKVYSVRPEIAEKRIKVYGSQEKYRQNYLCRNCRPSKK